MNRFITTLFLYSLCFCLTAQDHLPTDYLSSDFHKSRREALRQLMPDNSVAVFFANPVRNRANDVDYIYHQDPNFYYLTGNKEPHSALIIFSNHTNKEHDEPFNDILFVQERDALAEQWTGYRLGIEGAKEKLGFNVVYNGKDFKNLGIDFTSFDKVFFNNFHNDYRNSKRNKADLYDLISSFKTQIDFDETKLVNPVKERIYELITTTDIENSANVAQTIDRALVYYPELKDDNIINSYAETNDKNLLKEIKQQAITIQAKLDENNLDTQFLSTAMASLRQIKTEEELKLLTKAIRISSQGQIEVMKAMHPNMSEAEIQGIHEFVYKKYGSEYEGYPSIVGAGNNGCVLHYIENSKMTIKNDLVLMDLGAEYHGYTADVTRTIPANGKFNKEQKAIYDLVYNAQEAGIAASIIGNTFGAPDREARAIINKGLVALGIAKNESDARQYFPHGTSHYLGLDVHDAGLYGAFKANMVITVEPGIYIPEGSDCDPKWYGIAVRIEDDILITKDGPVNLSVEAPRTSNAIEVMMKQKSVLDDFKLPKLD